MPPYNANVVTTLLREWIDSAPRGAQSALARALGVGPQAVNKWYKGHNVPEPERWPAIEDHFGQPRGALADASGYHARVQTPSEVSEVARLRAEVAELRRIVERLDNAQGDAR